MTVFVTGASGFIGSAVVAELISSGHQVTALARSDSSAAEIQRVGARVHRGDLCDLGGLREAAEMAEAVVHLGASHDWERIEESFRMERAAVQAISETLAATPRPGRQRQLVHCEPLR